MKKLILILACLVTVQAQAKTLYKCRANGVAAYKTTPCLDGEQQSEVKEVRSKNEEKKAADNNSSGIEGLELNAITVKYEPVNAIASQWFMYKVDATNKTDYPMDIALKYKAVDSENFLIKEVYLRGSVAAHSTETLTDRNYFDNKERGRVSKWVLVKN
jgi:hypothetical protein